MDARINLFCITAVLLVTSLAAGAPRQQSEVRQERLSVKGRIVGYSMKSRLRSVQGRIVSLPRDAFLFLVERGNEELKAGEYVKIQYKVTPERHEDLPHELYEESRPRTFLLEKDETCDEAAESFIYGDKFGSEGSGAEAGKRFPNLVLLRGEKDIRLPEGRMLRCYSFDRDGIQK